MPAPEDLRDGGQLGILAREVRDLCGDVKKVKDEVTKVREDVAFIKGRLAGEEVKLNGSTKIKVAVISSIGLGLSSIIVAVISSFT